MIIATHEPLMVEIDHVAVENKFFHENANVRLTMQCSRTKGRRFHGFPVWFTHPRLGSTSTEWLGYPTYPSSVLYRRISHLVATVLDKSTQEARTCPRHKGLQIV